MAVCDSSDLWIACVKQTITKTQHLPSRKLLEIYQYKFQHPSVYQAISEFYNVYTRRISEQESLEDSSSEEQLNLLDRYLENIINSLYKLSNSTNEEIFKDMALITRTIQAFLVTQNPSTSLIHLIKEYSGYKDDFSNYYFDRKNYLKVIFECIKRGDLETARIIISKHPEIQQNARKEVSRATKEFFSLIDRCLNPASRIYGNQFGTKDQNEFLNNFQAILRESRILLKNTLEGAEKSDLKNELLPLIKILAGDKEAFMATKPNWIEYVGYFNFFMQGTIYSPEDLLSDLKDSKFNIQGIPDEILLKIICTNNMHDVAQTCSEWFPSYFMAHIIEVLVIIDKLPKEQLEEFDNLNYAEHYFYHFILGILSDPNISFKIPLEYLLNNIGFFPDLSSMIETAILYRINKENPKEIISYLKEKKIEDVLSVYYKVKAMQCLGNKDLISALTWSYNTNDQDLKAIVEHHIINFTLYQNTRDIELFLSEIIPEVKNSSSVVNFLEQYTKFCQAILDNNLDDAATKMIDFFVLETAPEEFFPRIFENGFEILQRGIIINQQSLFSILRVYEKLASGQIVGENITKEFLEDLNAALGRCAVLSLSRS
ncbi:unnamed protein product [Blepharisma stoltei]|uniref:Nuclear pore complex protein Nup85 n=1 Tax=Blepharisma stoltei TaxID=1481888 RepID=A0AAU9K0P6_9CILI|nr:unnamed protein product [Blepharisma stoltei]